MQLALSAEDAEFRDQMREFFTTKIPQEIRDAVAERRELSREQFVQSMQILNAAGLAVPNWPVEWGGRDWTPLQRHIWHEEMQLANVPIPLTFNASMVGPVIAAFGSQELKERFLAKTANLDIWWSQGFSEPDAGSDLASLRTTAVREGDEYVVNGQKTWTTLGQYGDWIFNLVRTDPDAKKQAGISFLLIDMTSPGVTVRPIELIDGGHEVNEVFFDNVRVPVENLVGEENKGWDYAKFLLGNERTGIARVGVSKERIRRIKELASKVESGGRPVMEDAKFREKLAEVEIELKALELTQLRVVADEGKHGKGKPNPASSVLKIKGSEIQQATTELLMEVIGPFAAPFDEHGDDGSNEAMDWTAQIAPSYFNNRKV